MPKGARLVAILLLPASSTVACSAPRCDGPPSRMIGGLLSHQTLADIRPDLRGRMTIDSCPPASCPAGELRIQVAEFEHLGHSGRLQLAFFDGRLYQAVFTPSSPAAYFAKVGSLAGVHQPPADGELWFEPSTRVHVLHGPAERGVAWEDECIGEEVANRLDDGTAAGEGP